MRDVAGLSLDPPERAVVLGVDEKSNPGARSHSAGLSTTTGRGPRVTVTTTCVRARRASWRRSHVVAGAVTSSTHRRHRAVEFKKFLQRIDDEVPSELAVHLVLDNSATHKTPAIKDWLVARPRVHPHFTPPSSAWLNLVARFSSEPTTTKIRRGTHRSVVSLERDIRAWIATRTENPRPDVWVTTADEMLESLARYCQRISDSRH